MKRLIRDRTGSIPVLFIGFLFLMIVLFLLVVEFGATYENYDYCMDVLQRSCNSAVERNIIDAYRADKILMLDTAGAEADFYRFMNADLSDRYTVRIDSITCSRQPPSMTVIGEVTFSSVFLQYGWDDLTFTFKVRATNYDLD